MSVLERGGWEALLGFTDLSFSGRVVVLVEDGGGEPSEFLSVVDVFRKTFGKSDVPFWALRLRSKEMSKDFSRR